MVVFRALELSLQANEGQKCYLNVCIKRGQQQKMKTTRLFFKPFGVYDKEKYQNNYNEYLRIMSEDQAKDREDE